jgi:hypothetical protein
MLGQSFHAFGDFADVASSSTACPIPRFLVAWFAFADLAWVILSLTGVLLPQ